MKTSVCLCLDASRGRNRLYTSFKTIMVGQNYLPNTTSDQKDAHFSSALSPDKLLRDCYHERLQGSRRKQSKDVHYSGYSSACCLLNDASWPLFCPLLFFYAAAIMLQLLVPMKFKANVASNKNRRQSFGENAWGYLHRQLQPTALKVEPITDACERTPLQWNDHSILDERTILELSFTSQRWFPSAFLVPWSS